MKKYFDNQHIFFSIYIFFTLSLGLLLARYDPVMAYSNAAICMLTIIISNQVIYAFKRANVDYRIPYGLPVLTVPTQNIARFLMLAAAAAQFYYPWSFDLRGFLNKPNVLPVIFYIYAMVSAYQIWIINNDEKQAF